MDDGFEERVALGVNYERFARHLHVDALELVRVGLGRRAVASILFVGLGADQRSTFHKHFVQTVGFLRKPRFTLCFPHQKSIANVPDGRDFDNHLGGLLRHQLHPPDHIRVLLVAQQSQPLAKQRTNIAPAERAQRGRVHFLVFALVQVQSVGVGSLRTQQTQPRKQPRVKHQPRRLAVRCLVHFASVLGPLVHVGAIWLDRAPLELVLLALLGFYSNSFENVGLAGFGSRLLEVLLFGGGF